MSSTASPEPSPRPPARPMPDRDVILGRRALVLGVLVFVVVVVIAVLSLLGSDDGEVPLAAQDDPRASIDLGPPSGTPVAPYIAERAAELEVLAEPRVAVVSGGGYIALEVIESGIEAAGDFDVIAYLVAMPGELPHVTRDVDRLLDAVVDDAETQLEELSELVPTVDDPEFRAFYEAEIVRYQKLLTAAEGGKVVFGAVVVGSAEDLRTLAANPGVRLVDVGPTDRLARGATVRGLRPEEVDVTGQPETRP